MKGDALPRNGKRKALESVLVEANAKLLWHGDSPGLRRGYERHRRRS